MKRTEFLRQSSAPKARVVVKRKRTCKNKDCKARFVPDQPWIRHCSPDCGVVLGLLAVAKINAQKARAAARKVKADQRELAARKEVAKPLNYRLKKTEKAVNRYVRARDFFLGCCSCDKPSHWDGVWHASHFKSVGSNSVLRFHLWNISKGCDQCNLFKSGNVTEYEKRLVIRHGVDRVEWLKSQNGIKKYTAEWLIRAEKIFTKKAKRAEKRIKSNFLPA